MTKEQNYTVSLKGGKVSILEQEVAPEIAAKIVRLLMPLETEYTVSSTHSETSAAPIVTTTDAPSMTAKQFMAVKQPKSDIERITCLAFYSTHFKAISVFKTTDLTHLNVEAAQPKLSNASATARNAVDQQYLALAGNGKKQITQRGEARVKAMPDRSAIKTALEQFPLHGRKRKVNSKKIKTKRTNKGK